MKQITLTLLTVAILQTYAQSPMVIDGVDEIVYQCGPCGCEDDGKYFDRMGDCPSCDMGLAPAYPGVEQPARAQNTVAILLFDGADIMDVSGPWTVFEHGGFRVYTVGKSLDVLTIGMSLELRPDYTLSTLPEVDILVLPGGGPAESNQDPDIVRWVRIRYENTETLFSVCSGAFFLGKAGLLDGQSATTFAGLIPSLSAEFPKANVLNNVKFVDNGRIVTSAGLSSGIDASFHVIAKYHGQASAQDVANHMEYPWDAKAKFARSQLADNYISDLRNLALIFSKTYLYSGGDDANWEYRFILSEKVLPANAVALIRKELVKNSRWELTKAKTNYISGVMKNDVLGEGRIDIRIEPNGAEHILILTAERI